MEKTRRDWLWYSLATIAFWTVWSLLSKAAADAIPPLPMLIIYMLGTLPVAFLIYAITGFKAETSRRGWFYGLVSGVLSATGGIAFFAALRYGKSTAVVVTLSSLYPLGTVAVAPWILKERLTRSQWIGVGFALAAIAMLSGS
jgi:uncharacterized membrane protein